MINVNKFIFVALHKVIHPRLTILLTTHSQHDSTPHTLGHERSLCACAPHLCCRLCPQEVQYVLQAPTRIPPSLLPPPLLLIHLQG